MNTNTNAALLFEHEDGRYSVNPDTTGDPKWHRLGPVDVSALSRNTKAAPADIPQLGANALADYLNDCNKHWLDPDIGGAFAYAFRAGAALSTAAQPPEGWAIVPVEMLQDWKSRVNTLAALTPKGERYQVGRSLKQAIADVLAAAPKAAKAEPTTDEEQAAFEDWLARTCPSGDVESVQRQWEQSSDYLDLHDAKAEPQVKADASSLNSAGASVKAEPVQQPSSSAWKDYAQHLEYCRSCAED